VHVSQASAHAGASRTEALGLLMCHAVGPARIAFAHELLSEAQIRGDAALAAPALAVLEAASAAGRESDPLAKLAAVGQTAGDASRLSARARAIEALAECMDDAIAAAELTLHATRIDLFTKSAESDAVLTAASLADSAPGSVAAAIAAVEALGEEDDIGERADALGALAPHTSGDTATSILAGQARLLGLAQRTEEALPILRMLVERDPDDLASCESLRVVARTEEAWDLVALACDRLARAVDGELRAQLLEEAAATLMDHVGDDEAAEARLRAALALDPTRPIAYARLHDVLADRGDEQGLLALTSSRIEVMDDPVDLAPLFYEQARLYRSLGDYDGAIASLENLLLFEAEHLGGLALLVEIHVQREQFREAVDALRQIATAQEVPASQRRIARLGAADFLDRKLDDVVGALAELRAVEELGLGDRALFERVAGLAERIGDLDRASEALERAAEVERDPGKRATVERRLAKLELTSRGRREHALAAYRRALRALPTDLESLESASALIADPGERVSLSEAPEQAFRARLVADPLDADTLHALVRVAASRGDRRLGYAVARVLAALGLATDGERAFIHDDVARAVQASPALLDGAPLGWVLASPALLAAQGGPLLEVALATVETLVEADRLEPGTYGLARGDLGKAGTPLVDEVMALAAKFGAPAGDVYVGGRDAALVTVIPSYKGKPAWVVGANAGSLTAAERRFRIGALALGLRLGVGPLATRVLAGGSDEVCRALFGAAVAASAPMAVGETITGVAESGRVLGKAIGRRARRTIAEAVPKIGDAGRPLQAWARALTVSMARAGALAGGDPTPALALARLEREASGALDPRAVVSFWTAPETLALRRELGLTT
jgi:tetratricopeptide (TPR) repeat protein